MKAYSFAQANAHAKDWGRNPHEKKNCISLMDTHIYIFNGVSYWTEVSMNDEHNIDSSSDDNDYDNDDDDVSG